MTNITEQRESRQVIQAGSSPEATAMLTMVQRAATDPSFDTEKMQAMMAMYERYTDRSAAAAFNAAMVRAQSEIGPVFRDKYNSQTNSSYAALESIDKKVAPVYTSHGFSLSFGTDDSPLAGHIRAVCDCMHEAGHTKRYHVDLPIDSTGIKGSVNKTGVHANGSTYSYARRYLTMMIFNVVLTNEDNDGNGEEAHAPGELMNKWLPLAYAAKTSDELSKVWKDGLAEIQEAKDTGAYAALKEAVLKCRESLAASQEEGQ